MVRALRGRLAIGLAALALFAPDLAGAAELRDLGSVDELKSRFNADLGRPRLVLLLSPT